MKKTWIAHLIRMNDRFTERLGSQFTAAITYFTFLSLVPLLMLGFSVAGFVLANQPELLDKVKEQVTDAVRRQRVDRGQPQRGDRQRDLRALHGRHRRDRGGAVSAGSVG